LPLKRILVIDDDEVDRISIRRALKQAYKNPYIIEADNGEEGIKQITTEEFDCVFLDYLLPDMDGVSLLKKVFDKNLDTAPLPIIMLTGQGKTSVVAEAIRFGAQDYLIKELLSPDTLAIAVTKAREVYDLKINQKRAEQQLIQSRKMDAIGQLSGGIAHDFNNLLQVIIGNASILEALAESAGASGISESDKIRKRAELILSAAEKGAALTGRMLSFAREQELYPSVLKIQDILESMEDLLDKAVGDAVATRYIYSENLPLVNVDKVQLETSLLNFAVNARDAMPEGGNFIIEAKKALIHPKIEDFKGKHPLPGEYIRICVSDTGTGIDDAVLEKVFDPFFTTKDPGKGTGLGLSMVFGFVEQSGGFIQIKNKPGKGVKFHIFLPVYRGEKEISTYSQEQSLENTLSEQIQDEGNLLKHTKDCHPVDRVTAPQDEMDCSPLHILLVEDTDAVAEFVKKQLSFLGHKTTHSKTADDALIYLKKGDVFDLVFSDVVLPGKLDGVALIDEVRKFRPHQKFLLTSGYMGERFKESDLDQISGIHILKKPYKATALKEYIYKVIQGHNT
tara:strand:- start:379 stop:2073 length:1695 start_codon:yes stop_codon:yes gene_type:complete